jgi:hypothetical protein
MIVVRFLLDISFDRNHDMTYVILGSSAAVVVIILLLLILIIRRKCPRRHIRVTDLVSDFKHCCKTEMHELLELH